MYVALKKGFTLLLCFVFLASSSSPAYAANQRSKKSGRSTSASSQKKKQNARSSSSSKVDKSPRKCSTCDVKAMEHTKRVKLKDGTYGRQADEGWYCGNCVRKFAKANASKKGTFTKQKEENLIAYLGGFYIGYVQRNMQYWTDKEVEDAIETTRFYTSTLGLPRNVLQVNRQGKKADSSPTKTPKEEKEKDKKPSSSGGGVSSPSAEYLAKGVAGAAGRGGVGIGDGSGGEGGLPATYENIIKHAASLLRKSSYAYGLGSALNNILSEAEEKGDPELEVCIPVKLKANSKDETKCYPAVIWAYGLGHMASDYLYDDERGKIIGGKIPEYVHLIGQWGLFFEQDVSYAENFFYTALERNTCDSNKDEKSDTCWAEMTAMFGLAMLASDKEQARKAIEKILNKQWDSPRGSVVMTMAISSLAALNTQEAWDTIDKFLTSTIVKGSWMDALAPLGISFWVEHGFKTWYESGGRAFKYYKKEAQFNQKDAAECSTFGYNSWAVRDEDQPPQSNTLEDIGYMLSQMVLEDKNGSAQRIVKKIVGSAVAYAKKPTRTETYYDDDGKTSVDMERTVVFEGSWPVVIGILKGGASSPKLVASSDTEGMKKLLNLLSNKNEFWDVNAGTQLHIWDVAGKFSNMYLGTPYKKPVRGDARYKEKFNHYEALDEGKFIGELADVAVVVLSIPALIRALPAMARGIASAARFIAAVPGKCGAGAVRTLSKLKRVQKLVSAEGKGISAGRVVAEGSAGEARSLEEISNAATKTEIPEVSIGGKSGGTAGKSVKPSTPKKGTKTGAQTAGRGGQPSGTVEGTRFQPEDLAQPIPPQSSAAAGEVPGKMMGPLDTQVQASKGVARYQERSLMPKTQTQLKKGQFPDREDGLVYIEQHPSNPQQVVMYYADDFGRVTSKSVPKSKYEELVGKMSETDKAILNRRAELHRSEIDALRENNELDRLTGMQKRINEIDRELEKANVKKPSPEEFAAKQEQMRALEAERASLQPKVDQGVRDLAKATGKTEDAIRKTIAPYAELEPPVAAAKPQAARYGDQSLMPKTKTQLKKGQFPEREDGLVYMEQDLSDPDRVIMYSVDNTGKVTSKSVPKSKYEELVGKMSETDKAILNRRAELHRSEIDALRENNELDRLTGMQKRINEIDREVEAANRSTKQLSGEKLLEEQKRIKALQSERAGLQPKVDQGVRDLAKATGKTEDAVKKVIGYSAGN